MNIYWRNKEESGGETRNTPFFDHMQQKCKGHLHVLSSLLSPPARQLSTSGSTYFSELCSADLLLPSLVLPQCPGYSLCFFRLSPCLMSHAKEGATIQKLDQGLYMANGKGGVPSPPQGFIAAGRCQTLQSCCCHSPAPLGTAENKTQGWGCCTSSMACWEASGSDLNGSASSRGIQFSSSHRKTHRYFFSTPLPTPHPSSILIPGSSPIPSHSQGLDLPAKPGVLQLSPAPHGLLPVMHPGLPQNLGHRTWQFLLDPPKLGVYHSLGTPCLSVTQTAHYLPGLPVRQGITYCVLGWLPRRPNFSQSFWGWCWHVLVVVAPSIQADLSLSAGKAKCCSLVHPPFYNAPLLSHHNAQLFSAEHVSL